MADAHPSELFGLLNASDPAAREAAWDRFALRHSRLLVHVARSIAHDQDAAMDAYAYVLEQLRANEFHRLNAYVADGRSKFTTWLVVVARRLCLDHHRARYGRASVNSDGEDRGTRRRLVDLLAEELDPATLVAAEASNPEAALESRLLSDALVAALATLEPRDRLLVKLRFEDDLPAREIAATMGFPTPFHVYRRLSALFDALRIELRQRGVQNATA